MFHGTQCSLSWWIFHVSLRICMLLLLDRIFHKCQLDQVNWLCCSTVSLLIYRLFIDYWQRVLNSPTIIVDLCISFCGFIISFSLFYAKSIVFIKQPQLFSYSEKTINLVLFNTLVTSSSGMTHFSYTLPSVHTPKYPLPSFSFLLHLTSCM